MRKHLYPVTKDEILHVAKLKVKAVIPSVKEFVIDILYETLTLATGLFLAIQILDKIL
jgi:hypothetical protein